MIHFKYKKVESQAREYNAKLNSNEWQIAGANHYCNNQWGQ